MKRIYTSVIKEHFARFQQMVFLIGPRQAGKTTVSLMAKEFSSQFSYLNWDNLDHRKIILDGVNSVACFAGLDKLTSEVPIVVFDEIHKYGKWKTFLKGFFDTYKGKVKIIVTGSSRLDTYKKGGDSLMGRYFPYRLHQLSMAELEQVNLSGKEISKPFQSKSHDFEKLIKNGGFPEPFIKNNSRFLNRWKTLRQEQLIREDIRDLSRIQELGQIELLAEILKHQAGQLTNYSSLANKVNVSSDTIRRWIKTLQSFFYCFTVQPWSKNIPRSLIKEPKTYLWDWTGVDEEGSRVENLVASHLLKAVHYWTDCGLGQYTLYFIRDKEKREVDFLVSKDKKPWFLVEVKLSPKSGISKNLTYFQDKIKAKHAFQVVFDMEYVSKDCFKHTKPIIVPARTFLTQLV
ncbi:MAG: ATP-binding protein [Candidatus Auribacterota bacterium]|nr:ATP-binding protein [Candidatus Auribacterota bacterium]